jgi:hypothetical protein
VTEDVAPVNADYARSEVRLIARPGPFERSRAASHPHERIGDGPGVSRAGAGLSQRHGGTRGWVVPKVAVIDDLPPAVGGVSFSHLTSKSAPEVVRSWSRPNCWRRASRR